MCGRGPTTKRSGGTRSPVSHQSTTTCACTYTLTADRLDASTPGAYETGMNRSDVILLSFVFSLSVSLPVAGQSSPPPGRSAQATRSELESQLASAQREEQTGSESDRDQARMTASNLNDRLTNGDFQVGDRVLINVQGQQTLSDTFTVREGQIVHLPNLTDIELHGVLRSELQGHVYAALSKYLRDPVVRTGSLVRLAVLGSVGRPGFYAVSADMLLSDAIMNAGGLASNADVSRTTISRAGTVVWRASDVATAIKNGETVDQLSLRAGDQLNVGATHPNTFLTIILPVTAAVVGIAVSVVLITRHSHVLSLGRHPGLRRTPQRARVGRLYVPTDHVAGGFDRRPAHAGRTHQPGDQHRAGVDRDRDPVAGVLARGARRVAHVQGSRPVYTGSRRH